VRVSAALALLAASLPALAEPLQTEERYPSIHGEVLVELQNDSTYRSDDSEREQNDLYLTIESSLSASLSPRLSLEAGLVFEPVLEPEPGSDRWLGDEGLYLETLFLAWQSEHIGLRAGKFNPDFGFAWALAPGIYGVDFAEDYELTERVGFGGSLDLGGGGAGMHRLAADLFFLDHSALSDSLVKRRGRTRLSDGGPSNTGKLESLAVTLQGGEVPLLPGLTYNLSFANQRAGRGGRSERGYVAGLTYTFRSFADLESELLFEYAYLDNADGEAEDRQYLTLGSAVYWSGWNFALSYTLRDRELAAVADVRDHLFQVSTGYAFPLREAANLGEVGIDVGWRLTREEGVRSSGFGALLGYAIRF
jgi:hypothetical protein